MNSPNLIMSMEVVETSTTFLRVEEMEDLKIRAKRSLMISRVGIRPRMIRSWLVRS